MAYGGKRFPLGVATRHDEISRDDRVLPVDTKDHARLSSKHRLAGKGDEMAEYLTVRKACEIAAISRSTFYKLLETDSGLAEIVIRIPGLRSMRVPERRCRQRPQLSCGSLEIQGAASRP